jgi:hypothetical protein
MRALSIAKFEKGLVNEDAAIARKELIAVSDGAGGGGIFADLWSKYLVEHLPDNPITTFEVFDSWIDGIWEPFYNDCEEKAKAEGGMLLDKFYDEGSFATLVAIWDSGEWLSYGDSVAFCYHPETDVLEHSFGKVIDFNEPPYLINCKDPLDENGFHSGKFDIKDGNLVFAASDALSHYILIMYMAEHQDSFDTELREAMAAQTKNSNFIRTALGMKKISFRKDVLGKLLNCKNEKNFARHLQSLEKKGLLGHDDYSFVTF